MPTIRGRAVNFGYGGTTDGITISGVSGILQSAELSCEGDVEPYRDEDGDLVAECHYNAGQKAQLELLVASASLAGAVNASSITTTLAKGAFFTISACAARPELIATNWRVMEGKIVASNTNAARISVTIEKNAGITATAS